jgi:type I restriction-modification system DNA methylase subunit
MTTSHNAYTQIASLVQKFKTLSPSERHNYNEADTRKNFILPLFRALGWDIESAAEVSAETKVSRGWVDYAFRLDGIPRFFLETKRLDEDLGDPRWIRQAIDYAWTKGVTWALLSNFAELVVFNAEWKEENPLRAEFVRFSVDTYLSDFERLWWLSRPATVERRLDREAEQVGKKARKEPVSQQLFEDLRAWRQQLFRNLRAYNKSFTPTQIDEAVLRTLNRLIFIRTAEDREAEPPRLLPLLRELADRKRMGQLPHALAQLFREFDATYNSDLFAAHFSEQLECEPRPFESLIEGLHEKRGGYVRYNFNALDADVLGAVYEQYLGQVVTAPKSVAVSDNRAKRKTQGIYYTPTFVVKYIVQQTLGRQLAEQGYTASQPLRILDMACGSGSFLIEAFDVLDRFVAHARGQANGAREDGADHARRMEILTQCIYGVDKDEQAVAVAKLNLVLKALHTHNRLPMLHNIRVGDSLIAGTPDELKKAFGKNWQAQRPFNWASEFAPVLDDGGFDVVVGNPPYVRGRSLDAKYKAYLLRSFLTFTPNADIYIAFLARAFEVLRVGGLMGFIIPRPYLTETYAQLSRKHFLQNAEMADITDFQGVKVFEDATVTNVVVVIRKGAGSTTIPIQSWERKTQNVLPTRIVLSDVETRIRPELTAPRQAIIEKVQRASLSLGALCYVSYSVAAHSEVEDKKKDEYIFNRKKNAKCKRFIEAREIARYAIRYGGRWLEYDPKIVRRTGLPELFHAPKLMVRDVVGQRGLIAAFDDRKLYADYSVVCLTLKSNLQKVKARKLTWTPAEIELSQNYSLHYLLGLLNSALLNFIFKTTIGGGLHVYPNNVRQLPIRRINFADSIEQQEHDHLVTLVTEMLSLQRDYTEAERAKSDERHALKRRMDELDVEIDHAVYALYELTASEINIIEEHHAQTSSP